MKKKINIFLVVLLITSVFAMGQQKTNQNSNDYKTELIPDINSDDSAYDDPRTLEFCLKNGKGINLCLYHNIRKQNGIDFEDNEIYAEWTLKMQNKIIRWVKQELDGLSVIWDYMDGTILKMETTSSHWSTKRGVKVGDPISKIMEFYAPDAKVTYYNFETKESTIISDKANPLLFLREDNEGILVYVANMLAEETMYIWFTQENGLITKIQIYAAT